MAEIRVTSTDGVATTVGAVMATTATDGWAVAHRGSMVAEEYLDGLGATDPAPAVLGEQVAGGSRGRRAARGRCDRA